MGNSQSCGFGVLNSTQHKLTVCLTMGPTHYWEENVMPGKIFYRWPGALFYTVYVYPTHGINFNDHIADNSFKFDKIGLKEVDIPTASTLTAANGLRDAGIVLEQSAEIALLDTYGITTFKETRGLETLKRDVVNAFKGSTLSGSTRGLYGGGRGAWLEIKGLPKATRRNNDGKTEYKKGDIDIVVKDFDHVMRNGQLTTYSYSKYHTY